MAEAIVEHDYSAKQPDELTIKKGDVIKDVVKKQEGWCEGVLEGKRGLFPDNFVQILQVNMRSNPSTIRKCKVVYSYKQEHEDELNLNIGDIIEIVGEEEEGWWRGRTNGKVGVFPSNFVEELDNAVNSSIKKIKEESIFEPQDVSTTIDEEIKINNKVLYEVKYAYQAQNPDELSLNLGDIIALISKDGQDAGWWRGELNGKVGVFPDNFVGEKLGGGDADTKLQPNHTNTTHVASQRRSQEIKGIKTEPTANISIPPAVPNKKPSIPFKKSPSPSGSSIFSSLSGITKKIADTIDGSASSKSVKLNSDVENQKADPAESYHAFDQIERASMLQDPRATRVKAPGRRPPSVAMKDDAPVVINGNSDYGSLEDAPLLEQEAQQAEIKPKLIDVQKPPWLAEMKLNMKRTSTSPGPADKGVKLEVSTSSIDENKTSDVSPVDMSKSMPPTMFAQQPKARQHAEKIEVKQQPKTPPNELERNEKVEKVVMRAKPSVNNRPQTIEAPSRPIAKTSPTVHKSPSPSPSPNAAAGKPPIADRTSMEMISSRHFSELNERIAQLETEMQRQRDEFRAAIDDLKGRLQVETDMRMLLQVELEKLQTQV